MPDAWMVNPHDIDGVKRSIIDAARADPDEVHRRMLALRHAVFEDDVERWANDFLVQLQGPRR